MLFPVYPSLLAFFFYMNHLLSTFINRVAYCQFSLSFSLRKIMQGAKFQWCELGTLQMATLSIEYQVLVNLKTKRRNIANLPLSPLIVCTDFAALAGPYRFTGRGKGRDRGTGLHASWCTLDVLVISAAFLWPWLCRACPWIKCRKTQHRTDR